MSLSLFRHHFKVMGGPAELQLYANSQDDFVRASTRVVSELQRIEQKYSRYRADSVVAKINSGKRVKVDSETAKLLNFADACYFISGGMFDVTSGVLRQAWNFSTQRLPSPQAVDCLLPSIGWEKVLWREPVVQLPFKKMEIDLGGFGKEYAVDRGAEVLKQLGIAHAMLNLSGDIRVLGPHANGVPWSIGVQHPRKESEVFANLLLHRGAVATSGDYERFFEVDGKRYCHILNPKTGWPVNSFKGVTVVAENCLSAGAAASIAMLFGKKKGASFLKDSKLEHLIC